MNSKYKILIVEDEFIIANQLKVFLQSEGYNVLEPTDCYCTSIAAIENELPDLVITDIRLNEDLDGGIMISKYISTHFNIPVIFLSGYSDKETIRKAKETNPNTFLIKPKPLDKEQLLATVNMALPESNNNRSKFKIIPLRGKEIRCEESYVNSNEKDSAELITRLVDTSEILFVETFNHHFKNTLLIRFSNSKKSFLIREEIEDLLQKLPNNFMRVHKSYIVNTHKIIGHKLPNYLLFDGFTIPIGDKHREEVMSHLKPKV